MNIPNGVEAIVWSDGWVVIKGQLGVKKALFPDVKVWNRELLVNDLTTQRVIKKMIQGVTIGFKQKLKLIGVGYKATLLIDLNQLELSLGFKDTIKIPLVKKVYSKFHYTI